MYLDIFWELQCDTNAEVKRRYGLRDVAVDGREDCFV